MSEVYTFPTFPDFSLGGIREFALLVVESIGRLSARLEGPEISAIQMQLRWTLSALRGGLESSFPT